MGKITRVLAIDLGASSGRGIVFEYKDGSLREEVAHRFPNGAVEKDGRLYWDISMLYEEICKAISIADSRFGRLDSVGIDTWGVDVGFVDKEGKVISDPRCYRDAAHSAVRTDLRKYARELFSLSGISDNDFNTTYQLIARKREGIDFDKVGAILFMPQLLGYMLTGVAVAEPTIASTSGFFMQKSGFSDKFLDAAGIDKLLFPKITATGEKIACLNEMSKQKVGLAYNLPVIAVAGHDTACAVAAIPCEEEYPLYISSGTWSLFGTLEDAPIASKEAFESGYTNELAYNGKTRFLRNIMGMWLIQECRRQWIEQGKDISYAHIADLAANAADKGAVIDVGDEAFARPCPMADAIKNYVLERQGVELKSEGEIALCVYKSLAKTYAEALTSLKRITGREYGKIYVIGGGSNNAYFNSLIADELGLPLSAGPSEASALGNALAQLISSGAIGRDEIKKVISDNYSVKMFYPHS